MALITLRFYSEALGMQTQAEVIIPQRSSAGEIGIENSSREQAYKCLYLLHGLSDDQTIWLRRTSIERYAAQYGICVVMPCADRSFYCNTHYGMAYYDYIAKELPRRIAEFFHVSSKREDNYIAGLSMGGYGALKIALRENCFCAGAGLSPCGDLSRSSLRDLIPTIFGTDRLPKEDDLMYLAEKAKTNPEKPKLFIAIGTEDFLYETCQPLRNKLTEGGFDFTYREVENASHSWEFWDAEIQNVLKWMFEKG